MTSLAAIQQRVGNSSNSEQAPKAAGFQSPLSIHLQAEAKRLAFENRARYYADPDFAKVPTAWLVSKEYAAERAKLIRPNRINDRVSPGQAPSRGDTTYFSVADMVA